MTVPPVQRDFIIRGYEVDATRTTPLAVVYSFLEQLRWDWIADPAWHLAPGVHTGHFFVVRRQVLEMVRLPRFGETVRVLGEVEKIGRSQVHVRHSLHIGEEPIGHARVVGIWLGPNRRLARLPDGARALGREQAKTPSNVVLPEFSDSRAVGEEAASFLDAPMVRFAPRGLDFEAPTTAEGPCVPVVVRATDCDVFAHVNASQYLRYFDDARRGFGHPGFMQRVALDYQSEALEGEALDVHVAADGDVLSCALVRDGGLLCTARIGLVQV